MLAITMRFVQTRGHAVAFMLALTCVMASAQTAPTAPSAPTAPGLPVLSAPAPQAQPASQAPPTADPAIPSAKDVLQTLPPGAKPDVAGERDHEGERELKELRQAYKGPFILGSDLFAGASSFRQSPLSSVTDDYRLGSGDDMLLYVFGSATFEVPLHVDRSGNVTVPKVGTVHVAGLRLGDARLVLQKLVNSIFSRSRVDLQFLKTRDVRIFILGEVYRPGSYVVPSLTSLLNALSVSGGPTSFGTYRSIQLLRDGKVAQLLDLYALRLQGLGMESLLLRDGDTLFVPVTGVQVLMEGAFVRVATSPTNKAFPGVLVELRPEESAWDAVHYIGGLLPSAFRSLITLQRVDPNGVISVENLTFDPTQLKTVKVFPSDHLTALSRSEWREGVVEMAGYAKVRGVFAHKPGMKVSDLLLNPGQIQPDTYMGRGQILRTRDDLSTELLAFDVAKALQKDPAQDLVLQPRDKVELFKMDELRLKRTVKVLGPFSKPGGYDWHDGMHASDLIFMAGVPQLNADRFYAELAHLGPDGQPGQVEKLDLSKLLFTVGSTATGLQDPVLNPVLKPYDQITLYELPDFKVHRTVTISGQVKRPGPYVITEKHFTLRQLIARAGGLTEEAMPKGGIFLRSALKDRDFTPTDLTKAGVNDLDPTGKGLNEVLQRLSETKRTKDTGTLLPSPVLHGLTTGTTNRMVVDFESAMNGDNRRDVELLDDDQIILPRKAESAYVVGEVASPLLHLPRPKG
ncbi:MAG: SLBB domain-containing protein [Holophaga sp.]|nr:SLBB domain-containing protein [Holophaga sp.]